MSTTSLRSALLFSTTVLTASLLSAQVDMSKILQGQMGQGGAQVEVDDSPFEPNTFIGSFRMEIHSYKGEKEEKGSPMSMRYTSAEDKTLMDLGQPDMKEQMKMLYDLKEKFQYMLMTDDKGKKMAMKSPLMKVTVESPEEKNVPDMQMTDETKMIEGHLCQKMVGTTEDGTFVGWMAKDMNYPFAEMMKRVRQKGQNDHSSTFTGMYGFPLEYEWTDKSGKERVVCYIRDLKMGSVDAAAFSLKGYEVMEMPMMPGMPMGR